MARKARPWTQEEGHILQAIPVSDIFDAICSFQNYEGMDELVDELREILEKAFSTIPQKNYRRSLGDLEYFPNGLCQKGRSWYHHDVVLRPYKSIDESTLDEEYWRSLVGLLLREALPPVMSFQVRFRLGLKVQLGEITGVNLTGMIERYEKFLSSLDEEHKKKIDTHEVDKALKEAAAAAFGFVSIEEFRRDWNQKTSSYDYEYRTSRYTVVGLGRVQKGRTNRDFSYRHSTGMKDLRTAYLNTQGLNAVVSSIEAYKAIHLSNPKNRDQGDITVPTQLSHEIREESRIRENYEVVELSEDELKILSSKRAKLVDKAKALVLAFGRVSEPHAAKVYEKMGCRIPLKDIEVTVAVDKEPECKSMEAQG